MLGATAPRDLDISYPDPDHMGSLPKKKKNNNSDDGIFLQHSVC